MESWYNTGRNIRQLLTGLLSIEEDAGSSVLNNASYPGKPDGTYSSSAASDYGGDLPAVDAIVGEFNQAISLRAGNLLVASQQNNCCFMIDPDSGRIDFLFELRQEREPFLWRAVCDVTGTIYCTLGGTKVPHGPFKYAKMDQWGAIVRLNVRQAIATPIAIGNQLLGPCGFELLQNGLLLVCGTNGFVDPGIVYTLDPTTGRQTTVAAGGTLQDPVTALYDADGSLWIANSFQTIQDGELLRIDPSGRQQAVIQRGGEGSGAICGVVQPDDPRSLILFKMEWPYMTSSAVLLFDKMTSQTQALFQSSPDRPAFYSTNGCVRKGVLWFGESYEKEIIGFDLNERKVVQRIDMAGILGPFKGMMNSYQSIENLSVIPFNIDQPSLGR